MVLVAVIMLSIANLLVRYMRWHAILAHMGDQTPWLRGMFAYFAGFAYTATPGKVGELTRAIYYRKMGVRPGKIVAAFVVERFFDLLVVSALAALIFLTRPEFFLVGIAVVVMIALVLLAAKSRLIFLVFARGVIFFSPARWSHGIFRFMAMVYIHVGLGIRREKVLFFLGSGLIAWLCLCAAFFVLCIVLGVVASELFLLSVYPAAMLAGAVTFIPGGVGSTELSNSNAALIDRGAA
jgi:uncharacterized membrane protein YbhN (UPF0104 family)